MPRDAQIDAARSDPRSDCAVPARHLPPQSEDWGDGAVRPDATRARRWILVSTAVAMLLTAAFACLLIAWNARQTHRPSPATQPVVVKVGQSPVNCVFDGASIWVTNLRSGTVTRIRAACSTSSA